MNFPKKSLGQNFLLDKNIIKKIVNIAEIRNKNIIEIGPGKGALTEEILKKKPRKLSIIEKDNDLFKLLKEKYNKNRLVKIINEDILKFDIEKIVSNNSIIFGNLPYNISSQILVKIIKFKKWPPKFENLIFMFQKELGEKIIGKYSSLNYGRLSIISNYRFNISRKFYVSPNCFIPRPKVNSVVIQFKPKKEVIKIRNIENLEKVTNVLFSNKRKMINKNLRKLLNKNQISKISFINFKCRPSELKPELFYKIAQIIEKN